MAAIGTTQTPTQRQRAGVRAAEAAPFIWREALWGLDWLSLRLSPVYRGLGVPHGDGGPVVLVPGFLTTDAYLVELHFWLRRIGYTPFFSGIGVNADCIDVLAERLEKTVVNAREVTGMPVRLVGHSLGGILARKLAQARPDLVSHLVSLGSPIRSLDAHPAILAAARFVGERVEHASPLAAARSGTCLSPSCECISGLTATSLPPAVQRAALYTKDDGVVPWRNCLEAEPHLNHEVGGTHIGLIFNPRAYRAIAGALSESPQRRRRAA